MPRVHKQVARKDYPRQGITKGDTYYKWSIKTGPTTGITYKSKTPPRPSQLTLSEFLGNVGDLLHDGFDHVEGADDLHSIADQVREWGQDQDERLNNMPDSLQYSPTGELLRERSDGCEAWADEIDSAADQLENDLQELDDLIEEWNRYDAEGGDEPTEDDPRDDQDQRRQDLISEAIETASQGGGSLS